ncbi:hypothetical protein BS47DRAFT_1344778 [Hydnum rufescens UP504]|uniref:Autophagy-related protein 14 n=1 Tax=Hydnum rufescens UP504 TaxID=1448309 RepID=A0A9P6AYF4_9AGAM|nr:hypothetical protein BS47DRAFT_1344778 [Hydnum rufescens UP504]
MENSKSEGSYRGSHREHHSLRHLSGIYVRNFTPFPRRDRVSSLSTPTHLQRHDGHANDDISIGLPRKRARRISTASVGSLNSQKSEDAYSEFIENDLTTRSHVSIRHRPSLQGRPPSSVSSVRMRSSPNATSFLESYSGSSALVTTPSQRILEEIISSRLVETFITLSILPLSNVKDTRRVSKPDRFQSRKSLDTARPSPRETVTRGSSSMSPPRIVSKASLRRTRPPDRSHSISIHGPISESQSAASTFLRFPSTSSPSPSITDSLSPDNQDVPFFTSSHHRPSTNPGWTTLDQTDFAQDTDLRTTKIRAALWGQVQRSLLHGAKGKEREDAFPCPSWQKLVVWDVDFSQLQPLAPDSLYYIPQPDQMDARPPSSQQYVSDGEPEVLKAGTPTSQSQRRAVGGTKTKSGGSWENTSRLLSLQKTLADALESLQGVMTSVDYLVAIDGPLGKTRQCEELQDRIEDIRDQTNIIRERREEVRRTVELRKKSLNERKSGLQAARQIHVEDVNAVQVCEDLCAEKRTRLSTIQVDLQARRGVLVRSLDRIFPLDPISSADLLFSILDVPLPIPINLSDPAPPLSDPQRSNINEESIATALGYIAHVVQLLAVYMGYLISYPITYAGSRSLIRDPISTMHGPRIFPLYSKGVDTYRFEYAVFLLNKDIEMLMTERNLQALDMRHTLPNLKNLLLTLTNDADEEEPIRYSGIDASLSTLDSFGSPKSNKTATLHNGDASSHSPKPSNPTTPTLPVHALPPTPRKAFFSPIAGLWLSRRSSTIANANVASAPIALADAPEPAVDDDETEGLGSVVGAQDPGVPASEEIVTIDRGNENDVAPGQEPWMLASQDRVAEPTATTTGPDAIDSADNDVEGSPEVPVEPTVKEGSWLTTNGIGLTLGKPFISNGILFGHGHGRGHEKEREKKRISALSRMKTNKTGTTTAVTKKEDAITTPVAREPPTSVPEPPPPPLPLT